MVTTDRITETQPGSRGRRGHEYSFNTPLATVGNATAAPGTAVSFTAGKWGTNILVVLYAALRVYNARL